MTDIATSLPGLFDRYADKLRLYGKIGATLDDFVMGRESKLVLRYVPFEYVNVKRLPIFYTFSIVFSSQIN